MLADRVFEVTIHQSCGVCRIGCLIGRFPLANNFSVMVTARFSADESALNTVTCTICEAKELRVYRHYYDCERDENNSIPATPA